MRCERLTSRRIIDQGHASAQATREALGGTGFASVVLPDCPRSTGEASATLILSCRAALRRTRRVCIHAASLLQRVRGRQQLAESVVVAERIEVWVLRCDVN